MSPLREKSLVEPEKPPFVKLLWLAYARRVYAEIATNPPKTKMRRIPAQVYHNLVSISRRVAYLYLRTTDFYHRRTAQAIPRPTRNTHIVPFRSFDFELLLKRLASLIGSIIGRAVIIVSSTVCRPILLLLLLLHAIALIIFRRLLRIALRRRLLLVVVARLAVLRHSIFDGQRRCCCCGCYCRGCCCRCRRRRKARTIDVSYSLGSMEDPRKKPEPDMEIAKAYRSIIMGPQRGNLGRGACFWDSDGKIGNYNRSRFSLVEVFTETSTHAPLQLFLMECHILPIISCCGTLLLLYVYSHGCAHQASKRSR